MVTLRWYQEEACRAAWQSLCQTAGNPVIVLPTGCHAAGHLILMANGDLRAVETITVGEKLMGPDGLPRTVLNICRGEDEMFLITPNRGDPFVVNGDHVLHLEATREGKKFPSSLKGGEVTHISVRDYLEKSKSWKHVRKLRQSDAIEFADLHQKHLLFDDGYDIPPYIVGLMLGDGHMKHSINLTTADEECGREFTEFCRSKGWTVRVAQKEGNKAKCYILQSLSRGKSCPARKLFEKHGLLGKTGVQKHIPKKYGLSPSPVRLELLAGLLDSDGHHDGKGGFQFVNKSERLSRGVLFVARSLGLRANLRVALKKSQASSKRIYWTVQISGNTDIIPTRLARKKAPPRGQIKNHLRFGFKVEAFGTGKFFGFTLDGDHLYLDGNFVIHHNSGKSLVIAELCRSAVQDYSGRVIVLAHRKELLEQNAEKIGKLLPCGLSLGVYSAGLRSRQVEQDIVVAGIQSVFRRADEFGARHLVLVDEVHLVPQDGEGMYRTFLDELRAINPRLRMIGLTATPFRTGEGALCRDDGLFQRVCYEAGIQRLISDGFLCPVTNKVGDASADTSGLRVRGGEFVAGDVERLFDGGEQVARAASEIVAKSAGRHSVLVFCSGVVHAAHVASAIERIAGERCGLVTGETLSLERANTLEQFKRQQLRFLCNVDVLTTGFDAPNIDCIAILRATMSPGLFAQMCGRGLRIDPSKQDCLILDFGENIKRHGPIDALDYGRDRQKSGTGDEPTKSCPNCGELVALSAKVCGCGFAFPPLKREPKHGDEADSQSEVLAKPQRWEVVGIELARHVKRKREPGAVDTLRVDYLCQPVDGTGNIAEERISEWVCLEHPPGYAYRKACLWWRCHSKAPIPATIDDAVDLWRRGAVLGPAFLETVRDGKWYRITARQMDGELPETWAEVAEAETWEAAETEDELAF